MNIRNVFVVTVTYGNRFNLLKQVIDSALSEGVKKVIVIDNNSVFESRENLKKYENRLGNNKLKVIYLDDNYGSAAGFKRGIIEAYNDPECDFIWLLDDDNKPLKDSLINLLKFWDTVNIENKNYNIALLSYRFKKSRHVKDAALLKKPELVLGLKNSFNGFHIKELHIKIVRYFKRLIYGKFNYKKQENICSFGVIPVAPYGGLFINKNIITHIGLPNEDYFVYADDHDWTYRITKSKGTIYLVIDSKIDDIDLSWNVPKEINENVFTIISKGSSFRVYYSIRNRVYFERKYLVNNKCIYIINILSFLIIAKILNINNYKLIIKAIKDGYNSRLGKVELNQ